MHQSHRHAPRALVAGLFSVFGVSATFGEVDVGGLVLKERDQDQVRVTSSEWAWTGGPDKFPCVSVSLASGRFTYEVRHDRKYANGALGISLPTQCNWYQTGAFVLWLNGEAVPLTPAQGETLNLVDGRRGQAVFAWDTPAARLTYTFALDAGDDRLALEVRIDPRTELRQIEMRLQNYPGGFSRQPAHELYTDAAPLAGTGLQKLDPHVHRALFLSDRNLDTAANPAGQGPSAFAFDPTGVTGWTVQPGGYGVPVVLTFAPETRRLAFCFWEFAGRTNTEALARFRQAIPGALAVLGVPASPARAGVATPAGTDAPAAAAKSATPTPGDTDNLFDSVSVEVRTPHIAWAKPLAGGPLKVAVLAPAWAQRETAELMQRFDLECTPLMTVTHQMLAHPGGLMAADKVAARFDAALAARPDAVVIGGVNWDCLLLEHREAILRHVQAGAGLVVVSPWANSELAPMFTANQLPDAVHVADGVPLAWLSSLGGKSAKDLVAGGTFGKGRWLVLNYPTHSTNQSLTPNLTPWPPEAQWEYDYCLSLLGRALLWAANRDTGVRLEAPTDVLQLPPPTNAGEVGLRLSATATRGVGTVRAKAVAVALATGGRTEFPEQSLVLTAGTTQFTVPVFGLWPSGRHVLSVWLRDTSDRVLAWCSVPIECPAGAEVPTIEVSQPVYRAGEPVRGQVILKNALGPNWSLRLSLGDNHGRLLEQIERPAAARAEFAFAPITPLGTNIHRMKAELLHGNAGAVASRTVEFSVRGRPAPDFHLAVWEEPETDYVSAQWYRRFRDLGVDTIFYRMDRGNRADAARLIAQADLFSAPSYPAHHAKTTKGEFGPVHAQCLHAPDRRRAVRDLIRERTGAFTPYDILFHPSGSDASMGGNCFCADTLRALRTWLQKRYASLADLNTAWQTGFATWDAVVPDTLEQAKARQQYVAWNDHTCFMEESLRAEFAFIRDTLAGIDAGALMGEDGYGRLDGGDGADWWQLLQIFGFYNLYTYQDPPQIEITRSLAAHLPGVKLRSLYYGSYDGQFGNERFMHLLPWQALFHGYNGLFWWVANGKTTYPGTPNALAGPDFRPTRTFMASKVEIDELRAGLAPLVLGARRLHSGVALFYGHEATRAVAATSHPSVLVQRLQAMQDLLEDLGLQYDYVAAPQIDQGLLAKAGYRALILVQALAMPPSTATAIRQFAEHGGVLLADTVPAGFDERLRPTGADAPLAGLFPGAGASRPVGDGKAVLIGKDWAEYSWKRHDPQTAPHREKLGALLEAAGVAPLVCVTVPGAKTRGIPGLEVIAWRDDAATYVGLINAGPLAVRGTAAVTSPAYVYDARKGVGLGNVAAWEIAAEPGQTQIFALTPRRFTALRVADSATGPAKRGAPWQFTMGCDAEGREPTTVRHAYRVTVTAPAGMRRPEYDTVVCGAGAVPYVLPFALNDAVDEWTVAVAETPCGLTATHRVVLAP